MTNPGGNPSVVLRSLRAATFALPVILALILVTSQAAQAQTFTVLHTFTGGEDGGLSGHGLTMDRGGNLYGIASQGGYHGGSDCVVYGCGTAFKLSHKGSGWIFGTLYTFQGGNDGDGPSGVVLGPDGSLYGTTSDGGGLGQCGTRDGRRLSCGIVFKLSPAPTACKTALCPWTETILYRFTGAGDGGSPFGEPVFDQVGAIYGTTQLGGNNGCSGYFCGTVFNMTPSGSGWTETALYAFTGYSDGYWPVSGVSFDQNGNLYGTTEEGGQSYYGTVFQLTQDGGGWTKRFLYQFDGTESGGNPAGTLLFDRSGNLYGTTWSGGSGCGTVYELTPSGGSWVFSVLYSFPGKVGSCGPMNGVIMDAAGNLYGTTERTGAFQNGVVFKLTPTASGWTYSTLHDFTGGSDGAGPAALIMDANGNLYGEASIGAGEGCNGIGCGVIFEITP